MTNDYPSLSLAIARLNSVENDNFALWVVQAPFVGGYAHHDQPWNPLLTHKWLQWQEFFTNYSEPHIPYVIKNPLELEENNWGIKLNQEEEKMGYSGRLMQELGINLWKWLFSGEINNSLVQSQGIGMGKNQPIRLRLDIRDSNLIPLPWEIMQPEAGKQAISLNQKILFSRTSSDVEPLSLFQPYNSLNILLVLGQKEHPFSAETQPTLALEIEAETIKKAIQDGIEESNIISPLQPTTFTKIDILIQPNTSQLIQSLDQGRYNLFFYAGHGKQSPDGGLLFLDHNAQINGTELAQVLARNKVTLALFNACWGAHPDQQNKTAIPRSSLAEVLILHGIPAVLAMRDLIADQEALSFIQSFCKALGQRMAIDQAVAVARQQLLTLYRFNQPPWTLPILYMHPEFNGQLIQTMEKITTELPTILPKIQQKNLPNAYIICEHNHQKTWKFNGGLMRLGRSLENDVIVTEKWVSSKHGEIICRENPHVTNQYIYLFKDFSRFGTFVYNLNQECQIIHHQEILLQSGFKLQLGSNTGETLAFIIEDN
jgi:hypothetical protein